MTSFYQTLLSRLIVVAALAIPSWQSVADEIRVAVASNFTEAARVIAGRFEANSNHQVILIFGSTGKHYAQIKHGAPFDAFLAADALRPKLLENERVAMPDSRFTFAIGKLALWSPKQALVDAEGTVLEQGTFRHLAIANPKLAPYGRAAQEVLELRGQWDRLGKRIVRGQDIGQAFQFVKSGNAELGFIALSQLKRPDRPVEGSLWEVPQELYTPIEQQAVLLKNNQTARAFLSFLRSDEALKIMEAYGYDPPPCSANPTSAPLPSP